MPNKTGKKKSILLKIFLWLFSAIAVIAICVYVAFNTSPWPSVLLIRHGFKAEGSSQNNELSAFVPARIVSKTDLQYDISYNAAKLDVYYAADSVSARKKLPLIVWVHGGGFVAGDKKELANYCKILASKGYIVAAPNYTLAPEAHYPVPVNQINSALAFLVRNADKFNIDTSLIIIAGDSGGAHIAAQLANVYTNAAYSDILKISPSIDSHYLKAVILFCGPYNTDLLNSNGDFGWFLKTVLWAYTGNKQFTNNRALTYFSVANYISSNFPRTFISVGNADPLKFHSYDLAAKLMRRGVMVDTLFFGDNYSPALPHEYQFNINNDEGKLALKRALSFLSQCTGK
jgi:acetyl esterase